MQANQGQGQNSGQNNNNRNDQKSTLSWSQPSTNQATPKAPVTNNTSQAQPALIDSSASNTGKYATIFIIGAIVGVLIGWSIASSRNNANSSTTASSTVETSTSTKTSGTNTTSGANISATPGSFNISSPQAAGFAVEITNVAVTEPTWIVIYEDRAGSPGNAIGAELFLPQTGGSAQNGTIELLRATMPGQNYLAGESLDDGDKSFSTVNDKPVRDAKGNPVLSQFSAK